MRKSKIFVSLTAALSIAAAAETGKEWTMWGGAPNRNLVSTMKGVPETWDYAKKENIRWIASLGSQSYGNPVVAEGVVLVGTNNEALRDPKQPGDRGVVMAFRETDGEYLWQITHEKLAAGRVNDWPYQGVCSSPLVENGIVYYVSNRSELIAADLKGMANGNQGPVTDEKFAGPKDGDILWRYDMMEELGNQPHNMSNSSPVIAGDLIIISTSNGQDESHVNVPSPRTPAVIAINKKTGKLVWEDNSVGDRILHGQWSSAAVGKIGDVEQAVIGQGDGWVRGYDAQSGKKLWEFDMNPKESVWPKTRNEVISTPIIVDGIVYIANGQDPEHGEGVGHLYAIDGTKRGDITKTGVIWHYDKIRRSISTGAYLDGLLYYADFSGFLHCVDAKTGKQVWVHDLLAAVWGSPIIVDGKMYIGDEDGDMVVMAAGREKKVLFETNMGSSIYSTPTPANGSLYVVNRNQLIAIGKK